MVSSASAATSQPQPFQGAKPYEWILHPVIDMLLCCGGLLPIFAIFVLTLPQFFNPQSQVGQTLVCTWLIIFSMPHGVASYLRVYNSKQARNSIGRKVAILGFICVVAAISTLISQVCWDIVARITWFLGIYHLFAQSYGICLVYCYKRAYIFKKMEQRVFYWLFMGASIHTTIAVLSRDNVMLLSRSLGSAWLPAWAPRVSEICLYGIVLAFAAVCIRKYKLEKKAFPVPAITCVLATLLYQGLIPFMVTSPILSALALTPNMHLTQYVVVTVAVHIKECGLPENIPFSQIWRMLWRPVALNYFAFILGAGWIASVLIVPQIWNFGASFGFQMNCVATAWFVFYNTHHYLTDAVIWKQRDPYVRRLLIS